MLTDTSIYDVRAEDVTIEGKPWDDEELNVFWAKESMLFNRVFEHYKWLLNRGRKLSDYYAGKIFDDETIETYEEVLDKVVIQPRIMKGPIRSLLGQVMKSRKSGQVVTENGNYDDPDSTAIECTVVNMLLKDMEVRMKEKYRVAEAVHESLVACYPNALMMEKVTYGDADTVNGFALRHLPWDSCLFGPANFQEADGSDIKEMWFYRLRTKSALIKNFPERKKQILDHFNNAGSNERDILSNLHEWDNVFTAESRDVLNSLVQMSQGTMSGPIGMVPTIQHLFPAETKEDVWMNIMDDDEAPIMKPEDWEDERWEEWLTKNPKYQGPYEKEVCTLWSVVFTTSGLVLECKKHWFQDNGHLPCSFWIPAMQNGMVTGPCDDMADDTLANAVAEIESLDEMRKGTGKLLVTREGAFTNISKLPEEMSKTFGHLSIRQGAGPIGDNMQEVNRTPNPIWQEYARSRRDSMYESTRINETMQGASAPRQSAIAKNTEIAQALIVNAIYMDNFNRCWEYHQNMKLAMIPFMYDKEETIRIKDDESKQDMEVKINSPEGYDPETGDPTDVVNDVTMNRYRFKMSAVDDSPTSKQQQMMEAANIANSVAGPFLTSDPSGKFFSHFIMAMDNEILHKAGKAIIEESKAAQDGQSKQAQQKMLSEASIELEKAKADMIRANKTGVSVSFKAEDLAAYPSLVALYQQMTAAAGGAPVPQGSQMPPQPPQMGQEGAMPQNPGNPMQMPPPAPAMPQMPPEMAAGQ